MTFCILWVAWSDWLIIYYWARTVNLKWCVTTTSFLRVGNRAKNEQYLLKQVLFNTSFTIQLKTINNIWFCSHSVFKFLQNKDFSISRKISRFQNDFNWIFYFVGNYAFLRQKINDTVKLVYYDYDHGYNEFTLIRIHVNNEVPFITNLSL